LGLGPFVLMKVVTGTSAPPIAANIADAAQAPAIATLPGDTLAKSDRLPVFRPTETKSAAVVATVDPTDAVQPPIPDIPPKIVPRHWHEGGALPAAKRKLTRRSIGKKRDTTVASNVHVNGL
jgi:hypothetical protein